MDDLKISPILPEQIELAKQLAKKRRRDARRQWWKDNWIALSALVVAVLSLLISFITFLLVFVLK